MVKIKFKRKPAKAKIMVFGNKHTHVKPVRRIVSRSTSIFSPIQSSKPVKRYWGDYDGDGVMNGLDCEPRNPKKQGIMHKSKRQALAKHKLKKAKMDKEEAEPPEYSDHYRSMTGQWGKNFADEIYGDVDEEIRDQEATEAMRNKREVAARRIIEKDPSFKDFRAALRKK